MPLQHDAADFEDLVAERTDELVRVVARLQRELAERATGEALLRAQAQALAEATERYELVARMTSDAVYDWDLVTNRLNWGPGISTMFGHTKADVTPTFDWWAEQIHPDDRERVLLRLEAGMAPGKGMWSSEYRFRKGDGSYAMVFDRGSFLRDGEGTAVRMIGAQMDVSERRRMEQRLVLADRMASVGALAAGLAHEINNPLTYTMTSTGVALEAIEGLLVGPVNGNAALAESQRGALIETARALREAQAGSERVRRIVRDLKTFARADEDDHEHAVDVRAVLDSALALAWNEIRHRARLDKAYGDVPRVRANESRLGQVFLNLLVNAAQAIPAGAVQKHSIALATRRDANGRVVIEVADSGSGIAPELVPYLFEPFQASAQAGESKGLGLAICNSLVEAMGGEIQVESTLGKGSTFRVFLPPAPEETWDIVQTPAPPIASVIVTEPEPKSEPQGPRGRVLIVDDEPLVRTAAARTLAVLHEVVEADSGASALAKLRAGERFDVILCDLMMPELTGIELFQELSASLPDQGARMLFLTGGAFTPGAQEFLDAQPRVAVDKPFKAWALRGAVAAVIVERGLVDR